MKGNGIIIPTSLRQETINKLHESHLGIVTTEQLARDLVFWSGISKQLEDKVSRYQAFHNTTK